MFPNLSADPALNRPSAPAGLSVLSGDPSARSRGARRVSNAAKKSFGEGEISNRPYRPALCKQPRRHNILKVAIMLWTTMTRLLVTFYRHRTRPGVVAVSPVSTNLVFPEPDDWELDRQDIINTDLVLPGSKIALWLEAFRRLGYCVLDPDDGDPRPPQSGDGAARPSKGRR